MSRDASRRALLAAAALPALLLAAPADGEERPLKKLIEFGWDEPDTAFLRRHIEAMERTPFDGCVYHVNYSKPGGGSGNFTWECWGKRAFTEEELEAALADLRAIEFRRFQNNFLRFNTTPADLDWFDDHAAVIHNARLAARIAREGKSRGILFDIEQYNGPLFDYSKQRDAGTKPWDAYAAQARKRGRETMEAFQDGFPDLVVLLTFGYSLPWAQSREGKRPLAECGYGLLAPFLDGMVEAARGKAALIDGHELSYGYREAERFPAAYETMESGLLPIVADREKYAKTFSFSFGIWMDHDWRRNGWHNDDPSMNYRPPAVFESVVRKALETADEFVWIYSETPRWWSAEEGKPVKLPGPYVEALRSARRGLAAADGAAESGAGERAAAVEAVFDRAIIDLEPPRNPWIKAAADIDGDGRIDAVIGGQKGPLVWYAAPEWKKSVIALGGYDSVDAEAADVDGDGDLDLIAGGALWYENPGPKGDPAGGPWRVYRIAGHRTHDVEAADLDGDGKIDVVLRGQSGFGAREGHRILLCRQLDPLAWKTRVLECPPGEGLETGDLDGDRDLDIAIGGRWYENPGTVLEGGWAERVFAKDWAHGDAKLAIADLDGNGRPDIILAPAEGTYRFSWFEAPADARAANWRERVIEDGAEFCHGLGAADFDGDGDLDLAIAEMHQSPDPDRVSVFLNQGGGASWRKQVISERGSHNIVLADFAGDGTIDILGANHGGDFHPVELWVNRTRRGR